MAKFVVKIIGQALTPLNSEKNSESLIPHLLKNPADESFIRGILQAVGFSTLRKELSFLLV